jgi:hypothetical protein
MSDVLSKTKTLLSSLNLIPSHFPSLSLLNAETLSFVSVQVEQTLLLHFSHPQLSVDFNISSVLRLSRGNFSLQWSFSQNIKSPIANLPRSQSHQITIVFLSNWFLPSLFYRPSSLHPTADFLTLTHFEANASLASAGVIFGATGGAALLAILGVVISYFIFHRRANLVEKEPHAMPEFELSTDDDRCEEDEDFFNLEEEEEVKEANADDEIGIDIWDPDRIHGEEDLVIDGFDE